MCSLTFVRSFFRGLVTQVVRPLFVFLPLLHPGGKEQNMSYNHGKEERIFEQKWKKLRKEYREAGMTEEAIEKMYLFDKEEFNRDRAYFERLHVSFDTYNGYSDEEEGETIDEPEIAVSDELYPALSRYWWIEEIDDPHILAYIRKLSKIDVEILTLCIYEGYKQKEAAKKVGLSPSTLSYRFNKIKHEMKKL